MNVPGLLALLGLAVFSLLVGARVTTAARANDGVTPRTRGLAVAVTLFVTPIVAFFVVVVAADSGFDPLVTAGSATVLALLGIGLYVFAEAPFETRQASE